MAEIQVQHYLNSNHSFASLLGQIYNAEKTKDESFSYRAFARHLGVSHGYLANIIKGERIPSRQFIIDSSLALGLTIEDINHFINLEAEKFVRDKYGPYAG